MDQATLKEILFYNPETGIFTWRRARSNRVRIGAEAGRTNNKGYKDISLDGRRYLQHRLAWLYMTGEWPKAEIDHINGDKIDNRISNLRQATRRENLRNRGMNRENKYGLKGVSFRSDKRRRHWFAQIRVDGKQINLGCFDTPEDAHAAYCDAAKKYHGAFAKF